MVDTSYEAVLDTSCGQSQLRRRISLSSVDDIYRRSNDVVNSCGGSIGFASRSSRPDCFQRAQARKKKVVAVESTGMYYQVTSGTWVKEMRVQSSAPRGTGPTLRL